MSAPVPSLPRREAWLHAQERRFRLLAALAGVAWLFAELAALAALNLFALTLTVEHCPATLDGPLYAADAALGGQPSFVVGRLFNRHPALAWTALQVYNDLPVAFVVLMLWQRRLAEAPAGDA